MIFRTDFINGRFNEVVTENYKEVLSSDDYRYITFTGGTIRLAIWKSIIEILNYDRAWLLGTGIGDTQNKLTKHYRKKNIYPGDEVLGFKGFLHYNAHNQYFEFLISTGLFGVMLFLIWLIVLFYKAIRTQKTEWICFLILMCFFFITESALNAHKGVMLFMLINSLYNANREEKVVN
jgi:O-antigen ligase